MHPDRIWLSIAIYRFYRLTVDLMATGVTEDHVAEFNMALQDVVVSAAHVLTSDRDHGRSCDDEDAVLFNEILRTEGHSEEECVKACNVRRAVMLLAKRALDASGIRRGDDPQNCDPGGGMRSPDDMSDDGQP